MSSGLSQIRPFFRTRLLDLRYREWTDGFNFENIPSNILDKSFHISTPSGARRGAYDLQSQEIEQDVVIRVFLKGYRNPASAIDDALVRYDQILNTFLGPDRLGCAIKNIYLQTMQILPLAPSNDNAVILEVSFTCLIIIPT
jgi:hypothetical protein